MPLALTALLLTQHPHHAPPAAAPSTANAQLDLIASIHGEAGAWAVAGYRMSQHALAQLKLERGSFDLQVDHKGPKEVKYACIVDGVQASSGASLGRLQLELTAAPADQLATTWKKRSTGETVTLRPTAAFIKKYAEIPREKARAVGLEVLGLPAGEVFEVVPVAAKK